MLERCEVPFTGNYLRRIDSLTLEIVKMKDTIAVRPAECTSAGRSVRTGGGLSLPPELQAQAARRLSWLALIYAATFSLAFFPAWITYLLSGIAGFSLNLFVAITSIAMAIVISVVARKGWLTHSGLLAAGLCFEVVGAFGISLSSVAGFFEYTAGKEVYGIGISWVCPWIVFFPLVLPSRPRIALMTAIIAASMGPLAFLLIWISSGQPPLPQGIRMIHIILFYMPNYLCAGLAYMGARIVYRLGTDVTRERELGSYQLEERIGQGGMGEVWRARHRMLIRPAAIKLIRADRIGSSGGAAADIVRRFEKEAQATAGLQSPHTVQLYDYGITDDGTMFYVMELLEGLDMDSFVTRFGPVKWNRAVYLLRQVCHSLGEAHERGLIHRDIKPANIFICRSGLDYDFVKVLDFGLVRRGSPGSEEDTRLTRDGVVGGTPAFLAPEMALGRTKIDGRVDIYAVGCVAYWLITGELVFEGTTPMELAMKHVQENPTAPSARAEVEVPSDLDAVILRCLKKEPADRPQSPVELDHLLSLCDRIDRWNQSRALEWWSRHMPEPTMVHHADQPVR